MDTQRYPHEGEAIELRVYARDARYLPQDWKDDVEAKQQTTSQLHYEQTKAGALRPEQRARAFRGSHIVAGIVYGLVNVRTDGETILCATMNEAKQGWNVQAFAARF